VRIYAIKLLQDYSEYKKGEIIYLTRQEALPLIAQGIGELCE
jgi:hypothetical protein